MASPRNSDLRHRHDVHQAQHRRLPPPPRRPKRLPLHPLGQSRDCVDLEHRPLLLEPLPVQARRGAVGLYPRERQVRVAGRDCCCGVCAERHDYPE